LVKKSTTKTLTIETQKGQETRKKLKEISAKKTAKPTKEKVAEVKVKKKIITKPKKEEKIEEKQVIRPSVEKYYESVGRRKRAVARVRVYTKKSTDAQVSEDKALIVVNDKPYNEYFRTPVLQNMVEAPLKKLKSLNRFKATAKVFGGGISGQADAIKMGLSRALVLFDQNFLACPKMTTRKKL